MGNLGEQESACLLLMLRLLLRHLFVLLVSRREDDGSGVATSSGPAEFVYEVQLQDEGPAPCFSPAASSSSSFDEQQQASLWCECFES